MNRTQKNRIKYAPYVEKLSKTITIFPDYSLGYDKRFDAYCENHGEFTTSFRGLVENKYLCKTCSVQNTPHESVVKFKERFFNYIKTTDYDYNEMFYKSSKVKISIICKKHGSFNQTPEVHLRGHGCPQCGYSQADETKIKLGYGNNFGRRSYKTKSGFSYVYVLKIKSDTEEFYKIGISNNIKSRMKGITRECENYSCECIYKVKTDCASSWDIEKLLHFDNKSTKYRPNYKFTGSTECFYYIDVMSFDKIITCCI